MKSMNERGRLPEVSHFLTKEKLLTLRGQVCVTGDNRFFLKIETSSESINFVT